MKRPTRSTQSPISMLAFLVAAAALLAVSAIVPVTAQTDPDSPRERAARGKVSFRIYCASCHGAKAEGDGTVAEYLKVAPTDLTRLAVKNDGKFPSEMIYEVIDGRDVAGHGSREMPVWGLSFRDPNRDSDQENEVRERVLDLVAFIASIQIDEAETE